MASVASSLRLGHPARPLICSTAGGPPKAKRRQRPQEA
jgi:hypothetical protein